VSLISVKFCVDLIIISKDTDHKTKWPRFWSTQYNRHVSCIVKNIGTSNCAMWKTSD